MVDFPMPPPIQRKESHITDEQFEEIVADEKASLLQEGWKQCGLSVFILGASGDLAKKKTYPALFNLFLGKVSRGG